MMSAVTNLKSIEMRYQPFHYYLDQQIYFFTAHTYRDVPVLRSVRRKSKFLRKLKDITSVLTKIVQEQQKLLKEQKKSILKLQVKVKELENKFNVKYQKCLTNCWGSFLKKILEFFSCKASVFNNLFEKAFSNINTRMNRNGNSFICCGVYECEMTSPLAIFSKASTLQSTHKLFSGEDWNSGAHEGSPIEISSTCTIFSACGIFLECLESDSK